MAPKSFHDSDHFEGNQSFSTSHNHESSFHKALHVEDPTTSESGGSTIVMDLPKIISYPRSSCVPSKGYMTKLFQPKESNVAVIDEILDIVEHDFSFSTIVDDDEEEEKADEDDDDDIYVPTKMDNYVHKLSLSNGCRKRRELLLDNMWSLHDAAIKAYRLYEEEEEESLSENDIDDEEDTEEE